MNSNNVDFADVARHARATLDAWRECGADRLNPVRFQLIVGLERRAAAHEGDARRVLDERVAKLIHAYSADVARATPDAKVADRAAAESESLAGLVRQLASNTHRSTAYPELPELDYFRGVWSRVRSEKQIRQSLAPVSGNAGPLNSSSLVHRALSLMSELSPGYLKQFMSYVDTLSWMEQMNGGAPAAKETPRSGTTGRSGRSKAR
ncbi:Protein of unknown function [Paraburkholderia fungorum]|uniref:DUF2894 domain-containing protein n=1 Tax=Paraburkholderia fungorum TaxID=134537 RepID=A0A1H1IFX3_9BURK|nr:DUF2894 domain-containing protein [Paraburkholderia fungorum]SDR36590.1 Protein of unknown function [Paraburkholderia fungorum]